VHNNCSEEGRFLHLQMHMHSVKVSSNCWVKLQFSRSFLPQWDLQSLEAHWFLNPFLKLTLMSETFFLCLNSVYPGQHFSHLLFTSYLTSIINVHYQDVLVQSTKKHHGECFYHSRACYDFKDWTYYKI